MEHYVNLRPARLYPGVESPLAVERVAPDGIDFVVVREGTEGPYVGNGGSLRTVLRTRSRPRSASTPASASSASSATPSPAPRPARASTSPWSTSTTCSPTPATCGGARSRRSAAEFPEVETAYQHVDAATIFLVTDPGRFDVIVTDNLFGDIITDIAAAIAGRHRPRRERQHQPRRARYPSMFEPVHGSAPDIAGQAKADPTATILSVAMLLAHLGRTDEAERVERGGRRRPRRARHARRARPSAVGDAIAARL